MTKQLRADLVLFSFSMLFLPRIGIIDLKSIALFLFFLVAVLTSKKIKFNSKMIVPMICIVALIILFVVNSIFYDTDPQIILRYLRCILSTICISSYIDIRKPDEKSFINSLLLVLVIHAMTVLLSLLIPSVRPFIYIISRYSKKYLPLRSTGLLSGYDFAGYFLNSGLILRVLYNIRYQNRVIDLMALLFIITIPLTSRVNTVLLLVEVVVIIIYMLKTKRIKSLAAILLIIPIVLFGSLFTILTIETFEPIKLNLMQRYNWISKLDKTINLTYADSTVRDVLNEHYEIEDSINLISGNGIIPLKDPGIIKTIYEGGVIAVVIKYFFYLYFFIYGMRRKSISALHLFLSLYVVLTIALEMKLQFFFSTGSYELLLTVFAVCLIIERERASIANHMALENR